MHIYSECLEAQLAEWRYRLRPLVLIIHGVYVMFQHWQQLQSGIYSGFIEEFHMYVE